MKTLTPEEQSLLPSDDDMAFYRQHGWYRSKRVLSEALLDRALTGIQRHFSGERDRALPSTSGFSNWKPGDSNTVHNGEVVVEPCGGGLCSLVLFVYAIRRAFPKLRNARRNWSL